MNEKTKAENPFGALRNGDAVTVRGKFVSFDEEGDMLIRFMRTSPLSRYKVEHLTYPVARSELISVASPKFRVGDEVTYGGGHATFKILHIEEDSGHAMLQSVRQGDMMTPRGWCVCQPLVDLRRV